MLRQNKCKKAAVLVLFMGLLNACTKVDINFGDAGITDPAIAYIDTVSYTLSTVKMDSFITSQSGANMIGHHNDPELGAMDAEAYFHLGTPGLNQVTSYGIYDSAKLFIQPNGRYYGDTTLPFSVQVYTLGEDIDIGDQTYFYNTKSFAVNANMIASATQIIKPTLQEQIGIPVNNSFATVLFNMLKNNSDTIGTNEVFYRYIKGISIKGTSANNAVYSFNAADSNVYMRIYYHTSNPNLETATVDFKLQNDNLQFNHITNNRTGTDLQNIPSGISPRSISSTLTGNRSFLQTAGGLEVRIDLPYLRNFRTENIYRKILKAELYIRPYNYKIAASYPLPSPVVLHQITDDNYPDSTVLDNVNFAQQSVTPVIDQLYGRDNYYLYDITAYINNIVNGNSEIYKGLTLQTPAGSTYGAVDRLILSNSNLYKSIEVRIYRLAL